MKQPLVLPFFLPGIAKAGECIVYLAHREVFHQPKRLSPFPYAFQSHSDLHSCYLYWSFPPSLQSNIFTIFHLGGFCCYPDKSPFAKSMVSPWCDCWPNPLLLFRAQEGLENLVLLSNTCKSCHRVGADDSWRLNALLNSIDFCKFACSEKAD